MNYIDEIMAMLIGKTGLHYAYTTPQELNNIASGQSICPFCIWQEICQDKPKEKCKDYESGEE